MLERRQTLDRRRVAKWMFHTHLWLGVTAGMVLLTVSVTGVLLNHKRALGLMPDVEHTPASPLERALPLSVLVDFAAGHAGTGVASAGIDRLDVRPRDGLIKVRFRDTRVTEVTVDLVSGAILHRGERNDTFLEKLHSGEIFGAWGTLLSDFAAVSVLLLALSGIWLWLVPKARL